MFVANPAEVPSDVFMYTLQAARPAMLVEGPTDAEKALAAAHWMYSVDLLKRQVILFAGRTVDKTEASFASCVIRAASEEAARGVMENDPAVKGGVFRARLFRFQPMLVGDWASQP